MSNRIRIETGGIARSLVATAALLFSMLIAPTPASTSQGSTSNGVDDAVLEWNQIALAATVTASQGPLPQIRSMTIVQVAVHDSVNAITREYETYLATGQTPGSGSPEAAAIAAAHYALTHLFPAQSLALDAARAASLAAHGLSESDPGIDLGEAMAATILALRSSDGSGGAQFPYTAPGAGTPGVWVAVGPAPALLPGWGQVTPWVIRDGSQFMPDGPPELDSGRYARDYNEVKELGSLASTTRTGEQTQIARFWLASPAAVWNSIARQAIEAWHLDLSETARVLALMYLAAADASITCWDAKYVYKLLAAHHGDPKWPPRRQRSDRGRSQLAPAAHHASTS